MIEFLIKFLLVVRSRLKSRARLEAENIVLRQQVIVLSRKARPRVRLRNIDRLIFIWLCRMFPSILNGITVIKPETVIRWHRSGFGAYWRWKSRLCLLKTRFGRIDDGARRELVSTRHGQPSGSPENPEHPSPMRDGSGADCSTKRKPSGQRASALRRTRRGGREIRHVSIR